VDILTEQFNVYNNALFDGNLESIRVELLDERIEDWDKIEGCYYPEENRIFVYFGEDWSIIKDTILHEMVHMWIEKVARLGSNRIGHGNEFENKMSECLRIMDKGIENDISDYREWFKRKSLQNNR